jgi:hypothetical protein
VHLPELELNLPQLMLSRTGIYSKLLRFLPLAVVFAFPLNLFCKDSVQTYSVPKESAAIKSLSTNTLPPGHPPLQSAPAMIAPEPSLPVWQAPTQWKEQVASRMVLKSYAVADETGKATITISSFPGDVGGLLANVNRWRAQLGLDAVTEAELPKFTQPLETKNGKATLVQLDGKAGRLLVVILPHAGETWFYKMVGDIPVVNREKENLINFVQSARYP